MTCVRGCIWSLTPTRPLRNVPRVWWSVLLWQRPKSTGTDGGFEKGAAVGCGGLSPYSARYLSAPGLMRVTAMPALLELCGLAGSERQLRAESWFGRLAGCVTITTVARAGTLCGQSGKRRRQSSGQISQPRCRVGWLARPKATMARPRLGRSGVRCLAARPSGLMKGALEIQRGHGTGSRLAGEKESFQAGRGGAVSYP